MASLAPQFASCLIKSSRPSSCHKIGILKTYQQYASIRFTQTSSKQQASNVALHQIRPDTEEELNAAIPFSQVPGPVALPVIGSLWRLPVALLSGKDSIQLQSSDYKKYGRLFRDRMASADFVYVNDVDAIEKVHRIEGKYPQRITIDAWVKWREMRGLEKGILIETNGERWRRMRTQLDKQMLRPRMVANYIDDFNEVASDFMSRMRRVRKEDNTIDNYDQELFNWSLETIGTVIYETRFGNFNEIRDPEMDLFINAVQDMFRSTEKVIFFPPNITKLLFRKWYDMHWNAWDVIFAKGKVLIDSKIQEINEKLDRGEEVSGFLSSLLASEKISVDEIYANVSELMAAAVDTTSNTMQWVIEKLSRHPDIQESLHQEVVSVVPYGKNPTYEDIQNLPLLKAVVKEILRLYPIAGVVTKVTAQDAILCGYHIPKGTTMIGSTFMMGRNPDLYPDPLEFRPERWLRGDEKKTTHSFAWLPFGHGPRMCVGRRIAELEMHILLAKLSQNFRMVQFEKEEREVTSRGILVPNKPVNVQYLDRH